MSEYFSENLRSICADRGPIAQICREIGINRQQFNRYLSGQSLPSAHNLRRICRFFDLTEEDMFQPRMDFEVTSHTNKPLTASHPSHHLVSAFAGANSRLRRYLGHYHGHFLSPSWEGKIMRNLVTISEKDNFVTCRTREKAVDRRSALRLVSRFDGLVTMRNSRIYIVECEHGEDGSIVETVLFPAHRQLIKYLRGMCIGVAWRPRLMPYTSRSIWKRLDQSINPRDALADCGVFAIDSLRIDPVVRNFLLGDTSASSQGQLTGDFY